MVPPALTYRARLWTEGLALAACGAAGSLALLLADDRTRQNTGSTAGQLALVLLLLVVLGPRSVRRAIVHSQAAEPAEPAVPAAPNGSTIPGKATVAPTALGEPTPLWHLPLVVVALTVPLVALGAWDAGLRVTAGCTLVGLAQALLLTRVVRADERATGRTYVRAPGSRILRGTRLAHAQSGA